MSRDLEGDGVEARDASQLPQPSRPDSAPLQPAIGRPHWPQVYYSLTLVFALVDWTMGANVRAVGLDNAPVLRAGYYGACLLCAVAIHYRSQRGALITLVESSLNVGILIVAVFAAYYGMIETIEGPEPFINPVNGRFLLNFFIAGGAGAVAFYQSLHTLGLDKVT